MLSLLLTSFCLALPGQGETDLVGFPSIADQPYIAGLFEEVEVIPSQRARAVAQNVQGIQNGVPFVNVLRWVDARPFRGKVIAIRQTAQLAAAEPGTSVRLWTRVQQAEGTVAYQDDGLDQATSSPEWQALNSVGAVAQDATDLWFGLIVEGTTPVNIGDFQIEVLEEAQPGDPRYAVPQRWVRDADVQSTLVEDPELGTGLRLTSFTPSGYAAGELPNLWIVREDDDVHGSYVTGRALLEAMRLGREPEAVVTLVQAPSGLLVPGAEFIASVLGKLDPPVSTAATHMFALPGNGRQTVELLVRSGDQIVPAMTPEVAASYGDLLLGEGLLHTERVHLRWASARHDAGGDPELTGLLFEASVASMLPWERTQTVRQASHSLEGHDCGHDHSDGSSHSHSHDH